MALDLWSAEYWEQKAWNRANSLKHIQFDSYEEERERFIEKKIKPTLDLYRQSDHDWFKDFNRRRGIAMHSSDLIYKLQQLNPHIFVQQQINYPDDWGLYIAAIGKVQFLTGVPKGWLTEFSYALVDERDLPTEERRGWRTVLIYCLMKGAITWEQVEKEFGDPQDGFNEQRWMETTHDIRLGLEKVWHRNITNAVEVPS